MLRNYIKIAFRNLVKHKAYTIINVAGLAVGMACCLLIFMLVHQEWSFDRFHTNADRIYRTVVPYESPDGTQNYQNMMFPDFTPALGESFTSIESATRFVQGSRDLRVGSESFRQLLVEVDQPFFEMFSFPFVAGDPESALVDRSGMVVTTEAASTLFGVGEGSYASALGNRVTIVDDGIEHNFQVTGVTDVPPVTSSLQYAVAISFENYDDLYLGGNNWGGRTSTYILLQEGEDHLRVQQEMKPFVDTQYASYKQALLDNEFLADREDAFGMELQPLLRMHHQPDVWTPYEAAPQDPLYSFILGGIGLLILVIACINFMTLSVGRSASRAQEVGMRKVMGANRPQLMKQFWGEALIMTVVALALGLLLTFAVLPLFNSITGQELEMASFINLNSILMLVILAAVVGLVAGGYPAVQLSRFMPAEVLKGAVSSQGRNRFTRGLVVLQYTISIGLIVGTLVMSQQLRFLFDKDLGYEDEMVLVVNSGQVDRSEAPLVFERFRNALLQTDEVSQIARSGYSFTRGSDRNTWTDDNGVTRSAYNFGVGFDYIDLMGMEIVAGRNFSRDFATDSTESILVNEALVEEFDLQNPVGQRLTGWLTGIYEEAPVIIGVVKDFNFRSLREEVQPAVMNMHPDYYNFMGAILVKLNTTDLSSAVAGVEQVWQAALPGKPFTYSFLDDDLAAQYVAEERWSDIVRYSSGLAILIACLGLFGLATLSVQRRRKEIGIRKVLGASISGVVRLVATEFAILVAIATVFAWPLAYFGLQRWLSTFAYRVELGPATFLFAGLIALLIAIATISFQAVRAGMSDPVKSLRYE
ncbi:MAG: FtsX-like permease family protein [Rhodothermales bacterium]|nr:FtsX-like permease family protein [Rhodothermales bacterium]